MRSQAFPGIVARKIDDPTGNPLERLQIDVDPEAAGASAATFARALGQREPAIIVRNHEVELGYFQLDPCNVAPGQAELVAEALRETLKSGPSIAPDDNDFALARNGGVNPTCAGTSERCAIVRLTHPKRPIRRIACALGHKACCDGGWVMYHRVPWLFQMLAWPKKRDGTMRPRLCP